MKIILSLVFLCSVTTSIAQTDAYLADLKALRAILEKTYSYKDQIKGDRLLSYNILYDRLASDTVGKLDDHRYFYNLSQLIFPLKDNHIVFYQIPDYDYFKGQEDIDRFVKTAEFLKYPTLPINIDSLKMELLKRSADSIEGIYHYGEMYSVGLFKNGNQELTGVVVDSNVPLWTKGQVAIYLYQYNPGQYKAIYGHPSYKFFILHTNEKYLNQSLANSYFYLPGSHTVYTKNTEHNDHVNLPENSPKFQFKNINQKTQYLLLRTFQINPSTMKESLEFYESMKDSINRENLVLDLRNNEGGATKEAQKYFKVLKAYSRKGRTYILTNNETLSQAEMLILRLKKLPNVTIVGQTTKGMLTYGNNYDTKEKLPSGKFVVIPTDMKGKAEHLRHENIGIEPDIPLSANTNWVDQVVEIINKK